MILRRISVLFFCKDRPKNGTNNTKGGFLMTDTALTIFLAVATVFVGLLAIRVLLDIWRDHFA